MHMERRAAIDIDRRWISLRRKRRNRPRDGRDGQRLDKGSGEGAGGEALGVQRLQAKQRRAGCGEADGQGIPP